MKRILNCKIDCAKEQFIEEFAREVNNFSSFLTKFDLESHENGFVIVARERTKGISFVILNGKIVESDSGINISVDLKTSAFVKITCTIIVIVLFWLLFSIKDIRSIKEICFIFLFFIICSLFVYYPISRKAKQLIKRFFQKHEQIWQVVTDVHINPKEKPNFFQICIILICIGLISFFGLQIIKDIRIIFESEMAAEQQIIKERGETRIPDFAGLEGGYAPKNEIRVGNYKILGLIIGSGKYNTKYASFLVQNIDDFKNREYYDCPYYLLDSGTITLKTRKTLFGEITFQGTFIPVKDGNYWMLPGEVTVLKGKLQIMKDNKAIYAKDNQEFKFHINITN